MRISDWSSDVCSSDLKHKYSIAFSRQYIAPVQFRTGPRRFAFDHDRHAGERNARTIGNNSLNTLLHPANGPIRPRLDGNNAVINAEIKRLLFRSEEHTSELQSLMRISYAVFCLKKKQ